jgi:hypothetical protein
MTSLHPVLAALQKRGWRVELRPEAGTLLAPHQLVRYPSLPADLVSFLSSLETCCNRGEDIWVLTSAEYGGSNSGAFRWNELEMMGLESAAEDGDDERAAEVRKFWDAHFPFMLAVHSDYDYLAVQVGDGEFNRGSVVHGTGSDFEEPSLIAPSFQRFLEMFRDAADSADPDYPFDVFLIGAET